MRRWWCAFRVVVPVLAAAAVVGTCGVLPDGGGPAAPEMPPIGLDAVEQLEFPPLEFDPPEPERFELSNGVTVLFLQDATLPMVDVMVNLKGGYAYFDREAYAAASALLPLMRNGGTRTFTVDSLDAHVDFHALGLTTSTDGTRMVLRANGLGRQIDLVLELWSEILLHPRLDSAAVERWRRRELEAVRRRSDFPGSQAVLEFNRIMFGDHPTGWVMTESDLSPEQLNEDRLRRQHDRVVCPENAIIGAAGALDRDTLAEALERALGDWQPCGEGLDSVPRPVLEPNPEVYVMPSTLPQSTIVVGEPGGVVLEESQDYFASRIANWVIGGSGFTSRLMTRVRTEAGLAYSAASVWGVSRDHERILGAITHTRADRTVEATRLLLAILDEARTDPPTAEEVQLARDAIVNGFVFGCGNSA
ncbi:MAG: M16 family metallopeptidase, partial [Gemmatimonadota bacterium]